MLTLKHIQLPTCKLQNDNNSRYIALHTGSNLFPFQVYMCQNYE